MPLAPPSNVISRTPIFRMVHVDCLGTIVQRNALHAPSCIPQDGLPYVSIHDQQVQADRGNTPVPCGPRGVIRDYVGFYLGPRSPMLYRLHTGYHVRRVDQREIVYLVATAQAVAEAGLRFVFTDRHSLARIARFSDNLDDLATVDFAVAYAERWNSTPDEPDRQERKQAEFLVHQMMPWNLVHRVIVQNQAAAERVGEVLDHHHNPHRPDIRVQPSCYY